MLRLSQMPHTVIALLAVITATDCLAEGLAPAPEYLGEIRRNAQGDVITVPNPTPASTVPIKSPVSEAAAASPIRATAPQPVPAVSPKPRAASVPDSVEPPHAGGRTLRVGPGQPLRSIADAAAVARDGDTVEIDAGTYVADVAIWRQDRLTLRGVGGPVKLLAGGKSAQGKAIWVIAGGQVLVDNIHFSGAKVPDRNGAGIRFERGQLTVKNCSFLDNENGILTANTSQAELVIENSEFGYNGAGDGYSHNLYVGRIHKLSVTGSYFHHAKAGHLLKSRAAENHIFYNRLTDEIGGTASYELEFPNGGLAYVVGNIIQQGSTTQNPTVISYGVERYTWPKNELYLTHNTIVDDYPKGGLFLRRQPGGQKFLAINNLLVGAGELEGGVKRWGADLAKRILGANEAAENDSASVTTDNNPNTDWRAFVQASRFDYRIKDPKLADLKLVEPVAANGIILQPSREYTYPLGTRALANGRLLPGAVQTRIAN